MQAVDGGNTTLTAIGWNATRSIPPIKRPGTIFQIMPRMFRHPDESAGTLWAFRR